MSDEKVILCDGDGGEWILPYGENRRATAPQEPIEKGCADLIGMLTLKFDEEEKAELQAAIEAMKTGAFVTIPEPSWQMVGFPIAPGFTVNDFSPGTLVVLNAKGEIEPRVVVPPNRIPPSEG